MRLLAPSGLVLLALALSACGGAKQAAAPAPQAPAVKAPAAQKEVCAPAPAGRTLAAVVRSSAVAYRAPEGRPLARFSRLNVNGVPTVFAVLGARGGCRPKWYRVQLPVRPNRTSGWVRAAAVRVLPVRTRIVIHLRAMKLDFFDGNRLVLRTPIAPGAPDTPTPLGRYYVTERLIPNVPNGPYGPAALGTSAFSPVLKTWAQGGPIGIHGTNDPAAIGHAVSHGCIRLPNAAMKRLFAYAVAGTPIEIRR